MPMKPESPPTMKVDKAELKERLDPVEYYVTQEKGTERPFSNKFYHHYEPGTYDCLVCGEELFASETKYHSGSGWPSFYDVTDDAKLRKTADSSGIGANLLRIVANPNLIRTEVSCKKCGSHLGHVFKDGPKPTGMRYCVNSSSLSFTASSPDAPDAPSNGEKREVLNHPATIDGCGADGICTLKSREALKKKQAAEKSANNSKQGSMEKEVAPSAKERTPEVAKAVT